MDELKYPLVMVEWEDAWSEDGWIGPNELKGNTYSVVTVGYVINKGPKALQIASTIEQEGNLSGVMSVPLGCVKRVRSLSIKLGGKRK